MTEVGAALLRARTTTRACTSSRPTAARISRSTDKRYDIIVVDAYHQPYIPFYLATRGVLPARAATTCARRRRRAERRDACPGDERLSDAIGTHDADRVPAVWRWRPLRFNELLLAFDRSRSRRPTSTSRVAADQPRRRVARPAVSRAAAPREPHRRPLTDDRAPVEWLTDRMILGYVGPRRRARARTCCRPRPAREPAEAGGRLPEGRPSRRLRARARELARQRSRPRSRPRWTSSSSTSSRVDGRLRLAHSAAQVQPDSPALEEALQLFARRRAADLARPRREDAGPRGGDRAGASPRTASSSGRSSPPSIRRCFGSARRLEPGIATGLAYPNDRHGLSERRPFRAFVAPGLRVLRAALPARIGRMLAGAGADAAMLHHALVTPKVVARCRAAGAAVFAWTVETAGRPRARARRRSGRRDSE